MTLIKRCRIGQKERCQEQGYCSWHKVFGELSCNPTYEERVMAQQEKEKNFSDAMKEAEEGSKTQSVIHLPKVIRTDHGPLERSKKAAKVASRKRIWERGGGLCYLCGDPVTFDEFTIDHVIPLSKGGSNLDSNKRPAHYACNQAKADKLLPASFPVTEKPKQPR